MDVESLPVILSWSVWFSFLWCVLQLLRIEEELGSGAVYAGSKFRAPVEPYWLFSICTPAAFK